MDICFATNNQNKLKEIRSLIGERFKILSLSDIGCNEELPENQETLAGNSLEKAQYVYDHYEVNCFADDTGLEVAALNGEPGVYSARYAGNQRNSEDNMRLLLERLAPMDNRDARFKTVISLIIDGNVNQFEGKVEGRIIEDLRGLQGFGYDPIFVPENADRTFAEMTLDEKNRLSHRAKAIHQLTHFLNNYNNR
ncbi:non-canonical purine NTP diphosphatase [Fulvivirgaceae bacterium BMA12]|uniref:dITP/XTP pyrophosphatase n=1 Tax=Agaribacillus aureus TaxID=3051825 RepID=A0ABT8LEQ4_9BACT|nr:non-canonical purine NTP diphosphatase [Fulvivirgaceae bacterium BMA12]